MLTTWSRVALARYGGSFVTLFVVFSLQVNTTWCFMDLHSLWSDILRTNAYYQLSVKISCTVVEKPCSHAVVFICCRVVDLQQEINVLMSCKMCVLSCKKQFQQLKHCFKTFLNVLLVDRQKIVNHLLVKGLLCLPLYLTVLLKDRGLHWCAHLYSCASGMCYTPSIRSCTPCVAPRL